MTAEMQRRTIGADDRKGNPGVSEFFFHTGKRFFRTEMPHFHSSGWYFHGSETHSLQAAKHFSVQKNPVLILIFCHSLLLFGKCGLPSSHEFAGKQHKQ